MVDQFGYRPGDEKVAVVRSPRAGFDSRSSFEPGRTLALVDARSKAIVLEAPPVPWRGGATDESSGDRAWSFDFSSVVVPGDYYVVDERSGACSPLVRIGEHVYRDVLVQATRMFYYQRDGIAKDAAHARPDWADGLAHPQDTACGAYPDGASPRDLHGGWFDAGDQNSYTSWAAGDAVELLRAYSESPAAFDDATGIPESGNGVPDVLDEVKWDLDWLGRMQQRDGSVLSIKGHAGASPPSADARPCRYGPATTSATLSCSWAFAFAARVMAGVGAVDAAYPGYAGELGTRAARAWAWARAHPAVTFFNAGRIGGGEQETDDAKRAQKVAQAAGALFALTGDVAYRAAFDGSYAALLQPFDVFHAISVESALDYTRTPGATPSIVDAIVQTYRTHVQGGAFLGAMRAVADPYFAYLPSYVWGSSAIKADEGNLLADVAVFGFDRSLDGEALRDAERYVHYLHGVNPLQLVYLSAMEPFGARRSVHHIFHTWFSRGSAWDGPGTSAKGPPPGFLVGGPNPSYDRDPCCPWHCGWQGVRCGLSAPAPPKGQPPQKSYRDFNDDWPLDSWSVSEPDDAYQAAYVRLLAKFAR